MNYNRYLFIYLSVHFEILHQSPAFHTPMVNYDPAACFSALTMGRKTSWAECSRDSVLVCIETEIKLNAIFCYHDMQYEHSPTRVSSFLWVDIFDSVVTITERSESSSSVGNPVQHSGINVAF